MADNNKREALDLALKNINKQFGDGSIMRLGDTDYEHGVDVIPTGSLALDIATGIGGVPKGRIIEILGPESSGKSTLCISIVANAQKSGDVCAYIDTEHSFDPNYATSLGADPDELIISQPDNGEQALEIVEMLIRSGSVDVVIVDSVAALTPAAEIEGEMGDQQMGLQAKLMSKAMRKLNGVISDTNSCLILTNQIRNKIGVYYGSSETTPGGNALKFYASMRFDIRRIAPIKQGEEIIGSMTKVKVMKNKCAAPFKAAEFSLYFGEGISLEADIINMAIIAGLIEKKGAWLSYKGEHIGQGVEKARVNLKENTELRDELQVLVKKHYGLVEEE